MDSSEVQLANMPPMLITFEVSNPVRSRVRSDVQLVNMCFVLLLLGALDLGSETVSKLVQLARILSRYLTFEISNPDKSISLRDLHPSKANPISVTLVVSKPFRLMLCNELQPQNIDFILVKLRVSHFASPIVVRLEQP